MTAPHMPIEEFRRHGHAMVDLIAEYLSTVESLPVRSPAAPGSIRASLPAGPPQRGEPFERVIEDVARIVIPGLTHWQHPGFFAYFPANSSPPAILGELLSAGLGVQGMLWATSPACTELESHVLDWMAEMLGLPDAFRGDRAGASGGGVIQDTASSATLCAMLAARDRATAGRSVVEGLDRRLGIYASEHAHSSVEKAMAIAGLGRERLRRIESDARFAMRPEALERAVTRDRADGVVPAFVCATVGTTSSGAIDPVDSIGRICRANDLWLHVDAAWAGSAAICPEFRMIHHGIEHADSYCVNPHKWMLVNFDCTCFWVRRRDDLIRSLGVLPEYLRNRATDSGDVIDYRDWQIPLGRRFRALKLWFTIRQYGVEGLREHIRDGVRSAQRFASWLARHPTLELAAPPSLALVCFRHRAGDERTQSLLDAVNDSGVAYLSHTKLDGRLALRMATGGTWTRESHIDALCAALERAGIERSGAGRFLLRSPGARLP
ncbi:MAG TPA: pyridoxal-dependent decarboxylase [Phycisphaerales bacterium]|nr:pyridoxal-dependent decarboxylase [Phycisphaerales bacterium]HMP37387.1 pyridoxal-dependent decarboxylase [Phycisphaerales bacterium]